MKKVLILYYVGLLIIIMGNLLVGIPFSHNMNEVIGNNCNCFREN